MCEYLARLRALGLALGASCAVAWLSSCVPDPAAAALPPSDLKPPLVLEAGPDGPRSFALLFDEEVRPVVGSFGLEPGALPAAARAEGSVLHLEFGAALEPGADYSVAGEAEDAAGNATRFVFGFAGWNGHPARLRLSEVLTAKNSSATKPHRDYLELVVAEAGNLGGIELAWASSTKSLSYRFPGVEVGAGDYVLLHLAPEGIAAELDEKGADLAASGGVDASAAARDFWCSAGALPDASGAVALRERPGGPAYEALFYADQAKSGELGDDKLAALVSTLGDAWPLAGSGPAWEDALRWKPSSARSLARIEGAEPGPGAWYVSAAGAQSPGGPNAPPGAAAKAARKAKRKG
jgi:hypothetical protein